MNEILISDDEKQVHVSHVAKIERGQDGQTLVTTKDGTLYTIPEAPETVSLQVQNYRRRQVPAPFGVDDDDTAWHDGTPWIALDESGAKIKNRQGRIPVHGRDG